MEQDITGRAVEQSAKIVSRVMKRVQAKVTMWPANFKMTRGELRQEVAKMRGEPLVRLAEILGDEEVLNLLRGR